MSLRGSRRCWLALVLGALVLLTVRHWPREPLAARIAISTAVLAHDGRLMRLTRASDGQYRWWTDLEDVSPQFVAALLLQEDPYFYWHPGVNPLALLRAGVNRWRGTTPHGGATLTMQLARLLYGLNTRTAGGRLAQMAHALQLELCYSKHDLLEAHLNLLPYGGNVQGVGTASRVYFGKAAHELELEEALSLVAIPRAPAHRAPEGRGPSELHSAREQLRQHWRESHPQTAAPVLPLQFGRVRDLPFVAPHFTSHLLAGQTPAAASRAIYSTLDVPLQRLLERVLTTYVRERELSGIRNAAALLVEQQDFAVRALVGSADFAAASSGQVNGTLIPRAPGEVLEPFVHALALDQGLLQPRSRHAGNAADSTARLTQPTFQRFLESAGIPQRRGGAITAAEVAMLYAMLANRGTLAPLRYRSDAGLEPRTRLLSEAASSRALAMLAATPPLQTSTPSREHVGAAWQSGTSPGFRDAWAAGVIGHYVLVVWVGNSDGSGHPAFVGGQAAAPLFLRIADALTAGEPQLSEPVRTAPVGSVHIDACGGADPGLRLAVAR